MFQFGNFLIRNASAYPDRMAFVFEDKEYTWRQLNDEVNRLANSMMKIGIKKGDCIAYMLRNSAEIVQVFLATQKIGAVALAINIHFLSGEISRIFDVVDCKGVVFLMTLLIRYMRLRKRMERLNI